MKPHLRRCSAFTIAAMLMSSPLCAQSGSPISGLISSSGIVYSNRSGKVYAVDSKHGAVVIVLANGAVKSLKTGSGPISIAVNERTGKVYVANSESHSVAVIDGETDKLLATVPAVHPYAIAVDDVTDKVYVSNTFSDQLTVIDGETNIATNLKAGSADAISVDARHGKVYLLGYESDSLKVLDEKTHALSKIPAGAMHL